MHRSFWLVKFWLVRFSEQSKFTFSETGVVEIYPSGDSSVKV